jgi:hypothetical protein
LHRSLQQPARFTFCRISLSTEHIGMFQMLLGRSDASRVSTGSDSRVTAAQSVSSQSAGSLQCVPWSSDPGLQEVFKRHAWIDLIHRKCWRSMKFYGTITF